MATKTDRILSYLPGTFFTLPRLTPDNPRQTALYTVVDAFGNELLKAENSLAALMLAHWVDHADKGAEFISDLACIAALYGLTPQSLNSQSQASQSTATSNVGPPCPPLFYTDEGVEEFREHVKRYVRTFIEGTVTVQGILRITAEALGLHIADEYAQMDTWWQRSTPELLTTELRGDDAAALLFGRTTATATGTAAQPARIAGSADLSNAIDLSSAAKLRLKVDGAAAVDVDFTTGANVGAMQLSDIVNAINTQLQPLTIASDNGRNLILTSPTVGASSQFEVEEVIGDAAPLLLGLLPFTYHGSAAVRSSVTSPFDLHAGVNLGENHYLRLQIDNIHLAEVDLPTTAATLDDIKTAINAALGIDVASHDGHFLTLTSPSAGNSGSITLLTAAAQDARTSLFGTVNAFTGGIAARAAVVTGKKDLSNGVDLSKQDRVRIQLNDQPPETIDCTGNVPEHTLLSEIVAALNLRLGFAAASHDGHFIRLVSPTSGPDSTILFLPLADEEDATALIFGIVPRTFRGQAATSASLTGTPDLSGGVDLRARHTIQVAIDSGPPVEVDLRSNVNAQDGASSLSSVELGDLVAALNDALGPDIASQDGQHLILTSPTVGSASRIDLGPLQRTRSRRFVTQAFSVDEAVYALFGFFVGSAQGTAATPARITGTTDLSRGVDVRAQRFLRIGIDGQPPVEVDCARNLPRPRVATPADIVQAINGGMSPSLAVASTDGSHLILTSSRFGSASAISLEPARGADALDSVLGHAPETFHGQAATRVSFVSTVDGSAELDLGVASYIKIAIDGAAAREINCAGFTATKTSLQEVVIAINIAYSDTNTAIASQDGTHIFLTSPTTGTGSSIEFLVPSQSDATGLIFGITPRKYHGAAATSAQVVGHDLNATTDLSLARFLTVAVDGNTPITVDCAAGAANTAAVQIAEIVTAIQQQLKNGTVTQVGSHLILSSSSTGALSSLQLLSYTGGDAHDILLGADVPRQTTGNDSAPATITGNVDLLNPVNLDGKQTLRLAVDGGNPLDIDVAGATPAQTTLNEIITQLNNIIPGLASADNDHLRLTSPTAGEQSALALFPIRTLELIEYPPQQKDETPLSVHHGQSWSVVNDSGVEADLTIDLSAPQGATWPSLVNLKSDTRLRLMFGLRADEFVQFSRDPLTGVRATLIGSDGTQTVLPGSDIWAGPSGTQAQVPFKTTWSLQGGEGQNSATLQLNNPLAPAIVILTARQAGPTGNGITVNVTTATLSGSGATGTTMAANGQPATLNGWVRKEQTGFRLAATADAAAATLAHLRASHGIALETYLDHVVVVSGALHEGADAPLMIVSRIADLFDVTLQDSRTGKSEPYPGVTIGNGTGSAFPEALPWHIMLSSQLVQAGEFDKGNVLILPQGQSRWLYLDGDGSRFDAARFGKHRRFDPESPQPARFAGQSQERAVFNFSHFTPSRSAQDATVFARDTTITDPPVSLQFHWLRHQPGAFVVNLPDDLPERFGSRLNQARFGKSNAAPEIYTNVVTEPASDPAFIGTQLAASNLVVAEHVEAVPLGWTGMEIPLYHPRTRTLSGGTDSGPAMIFLQEKGVDGFIRLQAKEAGAWGNAISITVRKGSQGPAYFDVTVSYAGVRLENARQIVLGGQQLPLAGDALLKPGPVGMLQAKGAGIRADVTRQRTLQTS